MIQIIRTTIGMLLLGMCVISEANAVPIPMDIYEKAWKPTVYLNGAGDTETAINEMKSIVELLEVVNHNTVYHPQTQNFVDKMWSYVEDFNLKKFYKILPDEEDEWRKLDLHGRRVGSQYLVGPAEYIGDDLDSHLEAFGDFVTTIKAKKGTAYSRSSYLLEHSLEFGLGAIDWNSVVKATEDTIELVVGGDERFGKSIDRMPSEAWAMTYRQQVISMNPQLNEEDIKILAPLWAVFPECWTLLSKLGKIDDVIFQDSDNGEYKHLSASFALSPKRMEEHYPELSEHMVKLKSLMSATVNVEDQNGRLLRLDIDSKSLSGTIEAYIKGAKLLSVKDGIINRKTIELKEGETRKLTAKVNTTLDILGLYTHINDIRADINYMHSETTPSLETTVTKIPKVSVSGKALGIFSSGFIDFFLPTNIDELMQELMVVAMTGNDGKGVVSRILFNERLPGKVSTVSSYTSIEALNNMMIRLGMGIINDKLIPEKGASRDLRNLILDAQKAFITDLTGYEKLARL